LIELTLNVHFLVEDSDVESNAAMLLGVIYAA